jgi:hypothetical protein
LGVTASEVFEYLCQERAFLIERHEISSALFSELRRGVWQILLRIREQDDPTSREVADQLGAHLSEWLTVPIPFDQSMSESLCSLGTPEVVQGRWGLDVRSLYETAIAAAQAVQSQGNLLRSELREIIGHLKSTSLSFRIFCHTRAQFYFESLFEHTLSNEFPFLHSVKDYRESSPFDVLIKVGPLRSRGWGSTPDALITAPRFSRLLQVVWSGCADEQGFGYDPCAAQRSGSSGAKTQALQNQIISWTHEIIRSGDLGPSSDTYPSDLDELTQLNQHAHASEVRAATLIQVSDGFGILYPPHSQVPTFDANVPSDHSIGYRLPGDTLAKGMFVIWPLLGDADLGKLRAGEGHFSTIWKERLRNAMLHNPEDLLRRLSVAGIELVNLYSCVKHWCKPASTVIHAPQQRRHFEILIQTLGITHEVSTASRTLRRPWWQYAWIEIAQTRGEAIQTGVQEHEIIDEQLFLILMEYLPDIRRSAAAGSDFSFTIPTGKTLKGIVFFYPALSVEEGFRAPDTSLKQLCELDTLEQWRA